MTHAHAEKAANLLIGAAIAGAACYVLKTPSLRRVAWRLAVTGLTGTVPAWFRQEIEQGWRESGGTPSVARPGAGAAATSSV